MRYWNVTVLQEVIYFVQADSEDEAREQVEAGEVDAMEYGAINQIMLVEEV